MNVNLKILLERVKINLNYNISIIWLVFEIHRNAHDSLGDTPETSV